MKKKTSEAYFISQVKARTIYILLAVSLMFKIEFPEQSYQIPEVLAILIFYQIVQSELKLSLSFIFIYSIFQDVFQDLPIGTMFLCYFIFIQLLEANRKYIFDRGPMICLISFSIAFSCILITKMVIMITTYGIYQISPIYYLMELVFMFAYYPWFHTLLNRTTKIYSNE